MEECDSGVGVAASNAGERRGGGWGAPWTQPYTALCINIATVGRAPCRLCR